MVEFFSLPLRPPTDKDERPDTLPVEIAQINNQWGSFREVNEDVLRAGITKQKKPDATPLEEAEEEPTELDATERREQLYKRRLEITQFAVKAHQETMLALDFISLLLSKHSPRQAETSMSPLLKQLAPLGSLGSDLVNAPPRTEATLKDIATVSRGWRMQSFNAVSNKLLNAATRLNREIDSETKYWNEVIAVKDKGWKVCRHPRVRQALAVRYGFIEATPAFRDRGLASLQRSNDGSLVLDQGLMPTSARYVRVQVKQGQQKWASSKPTGTIANESDPIEARILQARDSVFEEELFHELVREARALASCGVTTRENLISIPVADETEIMLDLVDVDGHDSHSQEAFLRENDSIADGFAHGIRVMLCFAHRQNLRRRTQIPRPLTTARPPIPEYHLLRPALAYLQHMTLVRSLEAYFSDIYTVLRSAGLDLPPWNLQTCVGWPVGSVGNSTQSLEALVGKFLRPVESVFSGDLLTPHGSFSVTIRTNFSAVPLGSIYEVSFQLPTVSHLKTPNRVGLREEAEAAITHVLLLDVVSAIASGPISAAPGKTEQQNWVPIYPHLGELLLPHSHPERHKKMKVTLTRHDMAVTTYLVNSIDGVGRGVQELRMQDAGAHVCKFPRSSSESSLDQGSEALMDFVAEEARQQSRM
ncbi:Mediator of RNA polymerase II transcription subunit 17 [Penicillium diatomitis]|uniref:Mediator of RNA polymerase II transcription subunit 17 n=1 Tax=Penicillium diatomitis TaxID=2819901 RepID=A0A9X0BJ71_9EURO|nr:Mediator of RNA polymerase II transcription subunit 17 [Penicillium diatomitis]KAJ5469250.1 Mediator of RNA polymerase II transcription subunit 17 [Penicillium diatomitis]